MILSDLNLNQPLPIQLSQVTNYVVINDPAFPPLSTIVVNGYDAYGNALSAVQVFPRTAKLVRFCDDVTLEPSQPNPIQLSQVTNYIPLYNDDATFPALSTTVVEGYNAYGNAIAHTQVFPRTVSLASEVLTQLNVSAPDPIQLSQVGNYVQVDTGIEALSCIVVNGYTAYGNAISAVQIFPRQVQLVKSLNSLNWDQSAANPIQLQQITNYAQLYADDVNYPALSTVVVNGYDAYGNALSSVQVIPRTASLIYKIDPATILDYSAPNPIQLSQIGNYVPLYNDDPNFPALSTVVVNGYDAYGNAISAVQVYPRMVSLVLDYNSGINVAAPLYFFPTSENNIQWSNTEDYNPPLFGPMSLQTFTAVNVNSVVSLIIDANTPPATNTTIENLSSYSNLHSLFLQSQSFGAVSYMMSQGLPQSIHTLELYTCDVGNSFTQQFKSELTNVQHLHFWADNTLTILDVSGLSALQLLQCYGVPLSTINVDDCDNLNTLQLSFCNSLKSLYLDNLSAIQSCITFSCGALSSFDLGAVTTLIDLEITSCPLSGLLDLSNNLSLDYITITNTSLSSIIIPPIQGSINYDFNSNELTQQSVDGILAVAASGAAIGTGSTLDVNGLNNSYPSTTGLTYISTLTANNWTVLYNLPPAWSQTYKGADIVLSNNNRTATQLNGFMQSVIGNKEIHGTDKVMYSIQIDTASTEVSGQYIGFGTIATDTSEDLGHTNQSIGVNGSGVMYFNGAVVQSGLSTYGTAGDIIDVAINAATKWWIRVNNGNWNNNPSADPATDSGGLSLQSLTQLYPGITPYGQAANGSMTLLTTPTYSVPSGFTYYIQ